MQLKSAQKCQCLSEMTDVWRNNYEKTMDNFSGSDDCLWHYGLWQW